MLFYFTGTGNSLYAAKGIEPDPISIPQAMRREPLEFTADAIGIVCPVYGHEVPQMVREFLRKSKFHTDYFYMVLTYGTATAGRRSWRKSSARAAASSPPTSMFC